jgi:hypothetical protein
MSENSGGSSSYYIVEVECPLYRDPYVAECGDISNALELNIQEVNIFKEIWRTAAARQGRGKQGHSPLRAAEKIKFFADRNLQLTKFKEG